MPERLSFLPDVDEAMKQAAVNAILEEDEESDGDVETENKTSDTLSTPETPSRSTTLGSTRSSVKSEQSPKRGKRGDASGMFDDEKELLIRDNSDKALWSMTEKVDVGNSWSGDVWIRRKLTTDDAILDGATTHNIFTATNEKKETSNDAGNESSGATSELVKAKMVVIGDDKKATIKWDRDEEDNETKGVSNEVVLDLNLLSYVQIVREEEMAHGSLASKRRINGQPDQKDLKHKSQH